MPEAASKKENLILNCNGGSAMVSPRIVMNPSCHKIKMKAEGRGRISHWLSITF